MKKFLVSLVALASFASVNVGAATYNWSFGNSGSYVPFSMSSTDILNINPAAPKITSIDHEIDGTVNIYDSFSIYDSGNFNLYNTSVTNLYDGNIGNSGSGYGYMILNGQFNKFGAGSSSIQNEVTGSGNSSIINIDGGSLNFDKSASFNGSTFQITTGNLVFQGDINILNATTLTNSGGSIEFNNYTQLTNVQLNANNITLKAGYHEGVNAEVLKPIIITGSGTEIAGSWLNTNIGGMTFSGGSKQLSGALISNHGPLNFEAQTYIAPGSVITNGSLTGVVTVSNTIVSSDPTQISIVNHGRLDVTSSGTINNIGLTTNGTLTVAGSIINTNFTNTGTIVYGGGSINGAVINNFELSAYDLEVGPLDASTPVKNLHIDTLNDGASSVTKAVFANGVVSVLSTNAATIDGEVAVYCIDGCSSINVGNYAFLTTSLGLTGNFASTNIFQFDDASKNYAITYDANNVYLSVTSVVPEPASMALMLAGIFVVAARIKRKN